MNIDFASILLRSGSVVEAKLLSCVDCWLTEAKHTIAPRKWWGHRWFVKKLQRPKQTENQKGTLPTHIADPFPAQLQSKEHIFD